MLDSTEETSKIPIIVSLKQVKGQEESEVQMWNMRNGEMVKGIKTAHKGHVNAMVKTGEF